MAPGFKAFESSRIAPVQRNKSALIMGICTTFSCFQTLHPRKRGFLHETGFSLPHQCHFDCRSSSESKVLWIASGWHAWANATGRLPVLVGGSPCSITVVVMCDLMPPNRTLLETIGGFLSV